MNLQQQIEQYINEIDATFGISIKHLKTKEEVHIEGNRLFQMASVVKVPILATLFDLAERGEIDLNERIPMLEEDHVPGSGVFKAMDSGIQPTIKDLATMMIIVSDNQATDKLLSLVGGAAAVEEKMKSIGLENIHIRHSIWDLLSWSAGRTGLPHTEEMADEIIRDLEEGKYDWDSIVFQETAESNTSTPKDMTLLMEKIALGEFVSEECSATMYKILSKQQYQQRIGGSLPRNTKVANKTGSLWTLFNDTGIVQLPDDKGAFAITVYSIGDSLDYKGDEPIAEISRMAYEWFVGDEKKVAL